MIVRIDKTTNKAFVIDYIRPEEEDEFLKINNTGDFRKIDSLPESRFGCYKYDPTTDSIVVDEEAEVEAYKKELIENANKIVQDYILQYYPLEKQNADNQQKDYYGTAILMIRSSHTDREPLTLDKIYLEVGFKVNQILDGTSTLDQIVSTYPADEQFYWEQLIKAGVRKAWVVKCVYVFRDYVKKVEQANDMETLQNLETETLEFPDFPTF